MTMIFSGPTGKDELLVDACELKSAVLRFPCAYWERGHGGATLMTTQPDGRKLTLLILPNSEHGIYLHYFEAIAGQNVGELLSLNDATKLDIVAECADEWYASIGLFLKPEDAWRGIEDFIQTAQPSSRIQWINPSEIPANGNW